VGGTGPPDTSTRKGRRTVIRTDADSEAARAEDQREQLERVIRNFAGGQPTVPHLRRRDPQVPPGHEHPRFVILSGVSGTGKTWLASAYADAVQASVKLVAVDPSWSSNEDLLGYLSPLDGFYHHTPLSEFVQESAHEWNAASTTGRTPREFHVILDEMNLARVEHYFSRFLLAMEVRSR
jgi:hypothetical protein